MTSSWNKELRKKSTAYQEKTKDNINWFEDRSGEVGAYVVPNILGDRFLSDKAARSFIRFFYRLNKTHPVESILQGYRKLCIKYVLQGGEVYLRPYPEKLGRAVGRANICNHINNSLNTNTAAGIIRRLSEGRSTRTDQRSLSQCKMSHYAAWVTWDESTSGRDAPFSFSSRKCPIHIRGSLGLKLDPKKVAEPLVLFEYGKADIMSLFRPTVADAGLGLRFAYRPAPPPPERDWYGLTRSWEENLAQEDDKNDTPFVRRPEALHEAIIFPSNLICTIAKYKADSTW